MNNFTETFFEAKKGYDIHLSIDIDLQTSLDDILKKRRKVESDPIILEKIILFILIFLFKISASIKIIKKSNQIFKIKTKSTYTIITTNYILVN